MPLITYCHRDAHSSPLFSQLGLMKLKDLVTIHTALFMFQFHHNLLPKAFNNLFLLVSSKHGYSTRLASKSTCYIDQVRPNHINLIFTSMVLLFGIIWMEI